MRRYMAFTFTFALVTLAIVLLTSGINRAGPCDSRLALPDRWTPPIYPAAERTFDQPGTLTSGYITTARPEQVFAFYSDELGKAGWQPDPRPSPDPATRTFQLLNCCNRGWLEVTARTDTSGVTQILVKYGWVGDCG